VAVWAFLVWERVSLVRDVNGDGQDGNFTVTGAGQVGVDIDFLELMDICIAENDRRLGVYDTRLLRPRIVPALARLALPFRRKNRRPVCG
jgi:hypothetical protein